MSRVGCRIYIENLSSSCREKDPERFFKGYGHLTDILIKQGYGFVDFEDYHDADDAVYDLDGKNLMGEKVRVEHVRQPRRGRSRDHGRYGPPIRTNYRIIVENLSTRVSWRDLKDLMRKAGDVTYADAHKDRQNEGVVKFASRRDMERAIDKFDDYNLNGRRIWIYEDRKRSRSQSRSRSSRTTQSRKFRSYRSRSRSGKKKNSKSGSRSRSRSGARKESKSRSKSCSERSNSPSKCGRDGSKSPSSYDSKRSSSQSKRSLSRDNSKGRDSNKTKGSQSKSPSSLVEKARRDKSRYKSG